MNNQYATGNSGIPVVFIGGTALVGEDQIREHFEEEIRAEQQRLAGNNTPSPAISQTGYSLMGLSLSPGLVIFSALADSANPCALSVLIFLLISMAAAENRKRLLLIGGTYVTAVFLFHLITGIGLFSVVSLSGLSKIFSLLGGAAALVLGLITIADVARNREHYLLSIPEAGKGLIGRYIRQASLPAAFVLGILAGLFGFSCTGGIYISILGLMGQNLSLAEGFPYLILYNLVFVLPLVFVTLLVAYGIPPERAEQWRSDNRRILRLAIGLIMIALGAVIFLGWLG
ncbi:cytochrome c biogenesis CcdA family protein [Methanoregula sp.]|uniref:cytochrome c biogenesis CcdA family protein n=1 Tax=Methanoregula sp. TaxID=2052170 RepID=UPI003C712079